MGKSIMGYMFGDGEPEETKTIIASGQPPRTGSRWNAAVE